MTFEFATATRIIFGEGKGREVASLARSWGRRVFVVTGWNTARCEWLMADLEELGCEIVIFSVSGEPTIELAERGAEAARAHRSEVVIGLGGGSVIDAAKAIAVLVTNIEPVIDYLEVIGAGKQLEADPLPFIAVPTTAGTGAEVTRNAVLSSPEHQLKVSLRSPKMLPAIAVVDPELTYELPPEITAYTGLDALTQLIEPFLCSKANPLTDGICREALPRVARALPVAFRDGKNVAARREMALGSLCGGLALANAGLGAVHGFAAPIGGMFDAPHGAVCAALLPAVMKVNLRAVIALEVTGALERFDELGRLLTSDEDANAEHAVQAIENLCRELKVPSLQKYAVQVKDFDLLCERAAAASSMKANPVELDHEELYEILEWSL